jgi:hypothetical protein
MISEFKTHKYKKMKAEQFITEKHESNYWEFYISRRLVTEWLKEYAEQQLILERGNKSANIIESGSLTDCQNHVEGIINDFEAGICGKEETISAMGEYTMRLMEIFWKSAKAKIKTNPDILNDGGKL